MASRSNIDYPRIDLIDIEPPGKQTEITWRAIKEGLREIFWPDINGEPAIVVLPHRIQPKYVCTKCMKSVSITIFTADAIRGHIALTRRCECGTMMYRRFLGAEKDVPVEIDGGQVKTKDSLEDFLPDDDETTEFVGELIDQESV
jgi:hypothetical protein